MKNAITYFETYFSRPPLEILADELLRSGASTQTCSTIFSTYDQFLAILDDKDARMELQRISRDLADKSEVFQRVRTLSHQFRDSLLDWLHMPQTELYQLVKQYGLF